MSLNPKLYVVDGQTGYAKYLMQKQGRSVQFELTTNPTKADIAMFTGGSDVSPSIYGQKEGKYTSCWPERDKMESRMFDFFAENEIPMIGICRGHQLFAAKLGGALIQHSSGHAGVDHNVIFSDYAVGKDEIILPFTSAHHQMIDPTKVKPNWKILGRSARKLSHCYLNGENEEIKGVDTEIECAYFPEVDALGIQGHPEWMDSECASVEFWRNLIKEYLL